MTNQTNDFLPQGYEPPKQVSGYMKLTEGEHKFRILSKPIVGWLDWIDKKPLRFPLDKKPAAPIDPERPIKHFWAMVVWNYADEAIQILEVTQASIQKRITALANDPDWKDPKNYDLKIVRTGKGMDTEYVVSPVPHKEITPEVIEALVKKPVKLEELFSGGDPFFVGGL